MDYLLLTLLALAGLVLMFIILLQRGRGGGLAGAFGGLGGQSAFGTKAGDVFTKITVGVTVVWVALAAVGVLSLRSGATPGSRFDPGTPEGVNTRPGASAPAEAGESSGNDAAGEGTGAGDSASEPGGDDESSGEGTSDE